MWGLRSLRVGGIQRIAFRWHSRRSSTKPSHRRSRIGKGRRQEWRLGVDSRRLGSIQDIGCLRTAIRAGGHEILRGHLTDYSHPQLLPLITS